MHNFFQSLELLYWNWMMDWIRQKLKKKDKQIIKKKNQEKKQQTNNPPPKKQKRKVLLCPGWCKVFQNFLQKINVIWKQGSSKIKISLLQIWDSVTKAVSAYPCPLPVIISIFTRFLHKYTCTLCNLTKIVIIVILFSLLFSTHIPMFVAEQYKATISLSTPFN